MTEREMILEHLVEEHGSFGDKEALKKLIENQKQPKKRNLYSFPLKGKTIVGDQFYDRDLKRWCGCQSGVDIKHVAVVSGPIRRRDIYNRKES